MACVDVPELALQILLRAHPEWPDWEREPAAVVDEERPQGVVLQVSRRARQLGVVPGLRYAAGLALAPGLRAGAVGPAAVAESVAVLAERLRGFTPGVEPSAEEPGVFGSGSV